MHSDQILLVPIAAGELIDKITILRLKADNLRKPESLKNVRQELKALEAIQSQGRMLHSNAMQSLTGQLQEINSQLWEVEDAIRLHEAAQRFDDDFIELARSVYQLNDKRAAVKRKINEICDSTFTEEKSYGNQH